MFQLTLSHTLRVLLQCPLSPPPIQLLELIVILPSCLYLLRQFINLDRDYFTKYIVCPKCTKLYAYDACLKVDQNNRTVAKTCSNTFMSRGKKKICNAQLVKKVKLKDGKDQFYPINYYCYSSVIEQLERVLGQKGIPESCEEWREQPQTEGTLSNVYSGQISKLLGKSFSVPAKELWTDAEL